MKFVKSKKITGFMIVVACLLSLAAASYAEVLERIVAIVNEELILLSEFNSVLHSAREADSSVSPEGVLNEMIENMLLLGEAKKYRTSPVDKSRKTDMQNREVIQEYIDRRIRALIHIPYARIEQYYQNNSGLFRDRGIIDVRDEIEAQLVESELKIKLREHIDELRSRAYIRTRLTEVN